jgi:hypothetical protein
VGDRIEVVATPAAGRRRRSGWQKSAAWTAFSDRGSPAGQCSRGAHQPSTCEPDARRARKSARSGLHADAAQAAARRLRPSGLARARFDSTCATSRPAGKRDTAALQLLVALNEHGALLHQARRGAPAPRSALIDAGATCHTYAATSRTYAWGGGSPTAAAMDRG